MNDLTWIYGRRAVESYLSRQSGAGVVRMCLAEPACAWRKDLARQVSSQWQPVSWFDQQFGDVVHQGVAIAVRPSPVWTLTDLANWLTDRVADQATVVMLDRVQDPRNFGACWRTAAAWNVDALIVPQHRSASLLSPVARKVACGGDVFVPVVQVAQLNQAIRLLQSAGFWVYGTSEHSQDSIGQESFSDRVCWVVGNEGKGIGPALQKHCDRLLTIPATGGLASLNVSVALGTCLYQQSCCKNG